MNEPGPDGARSTEQSRTMGGVIDVLEAIGATYAIWGGLAVVGHGEQAILQRALEERVRLPFDEMREAAYVPVEGAIASKLLAYADSESTRHLDDVGSIIRVQGSVINAARIDVVAARLGLLGVWRRLWEENRLE